MALRCVAPVLLALLAGCTAPAHTAPTLYLAGDGELWVVDTGTERVRHVVTSQLKPGDTPHRILARGHRIVMGTPYGDSAFFLPSARRDRVWVIDLRASDATVRAVREVTVDGETTVAAVRTPTAQWPLGVVRDGLLLESHGGVDVWNPATQLTLHHLDVPPGEIGAAAGYTVTACDDACLDLRLIDVRTDATRVVRAPPGSLFEPWTGAFSPDGELLALTVRRTQAQRRLALVDVRTGRVGVVPGSDVPAGYTLIAWSATGSHVFLSGGDRFERRVIVGYRVGTRAAHVLDVTVGDFYDLAAT